MVTNQESSSEMPAFTAKGHSSAESGEYVRTVHSNVIHGMQMQLHQMSRVRNHVRN